MVGSWSRPRRRTPPLHMVERGPGGEARPISLLQSTALTTRPGRPSMPPRARARQPKTVSTLRHKEGLPPQHPHRRVPAGDDRRRAARHPRGLPSRNTDLDPQLVWRGKDEQDESRPDRRQAPTAVHPREGPPQRPHGGRPDAPRVPPPSQQDDSTTQLDLFADFNGLHGPRRPRRVLPARGQSWTNRMILGDSLQVMASLAESARNCAGRSSASTWIHPTASSLTPTSSGPPPAATCAMATSPT